MNRFVRTSFYNFCCKPWDIECYFVVRTRTWKWRRNTTLHACPGGRVPRSQGLPQPNASCLASVAFLPRTNVTTAWPMHKHPSTFQICRSFGQFVLILSRFLWLDTGLWIDYWIYWTLTHLVTTYYNFTNLWYSRYYSLSSTGSLGVAALRDDFQQRGVLRPHSPAKRATYNKLGRAQKLQMFLLIQT
jgi:hypothetical protein